MGSDWNQNGILIYRRCSVTPWLPLKAMEPEQNVSDWNDIGVGRSSNCSSYTWKRWWCVNSGRVIDIWMTVIEILLNKISNEGNDRTLNISSFHVILCKINNCSHKKLLLHISATFLKVLLVVYIIETFNNLVYIYTVIAYVITYCASSNL